MTNDTAVVVDDWLYIDGGELYALVNNNPTFFYRMFAAVWLLRLVEISDVDCWPCLPFLPVYPALFEPLITTDEICSGADSINRSFKILDQ